MEAPALLACIEAIHARREVFTGKNIKEFHAVDGIWRLRIQFRSDGTLKAIQLRTPRAGEGPWYSMRRIREELGAMNCMRVAFARAPFARQMPS